MTTPRPPAHLEIYVRVLGPDAAVEFLLAFGGAELYLARDPKGRSRLAEVIGLDKARALAEAAETHHLPRRVPVGKTWVARVLAGRGLPNAEIARRLHVTDVTVRRYLAGTEADPVEDPRQPRLI